MFKLIIFIVDTIIFIVDENEYSNGQNQRLRVISQSYKLRVAPTNILILYFVCRHCAMPMWDFKVQIHSELPNYQRSHVAANYSGSTEEKSADRSAAGAFLFIGGVLTKCIGHPEATSLASIRPLRCTSVLLKASHPKEKPMLSNALSTASRVCTKDMPPTSEK